MHMLVCCRARAARDRVVAAGQHCDVARSGVGVLARMRGAGRLAVASSVGVGPAAKR